MDKYSQQVGSLYIIVSHDSDGPDAYGEDRQTYAYTITHERHVEQGRDLHTGVGMYSDARTMFATLCAFLTAYGEAYQANHLSFNESYADVPAWLQEACYLNSEELDMARFEIEEPEEA